MKIPAWFLNEECSNLKQTNSFTGELALKSLFVYSSPLSLLIRAHCLSKHEHFWHVNWTVAGARQRHCNTAAVTKTGLLIRRQFDRWTPVFAQRTPWSLKPWDAFLSQQIINSGCSEEFLLKLLRVWTYSLEKPIKTVIKISPF